MGIRGAGVPPALTRYYESPQQVITTAGALTLAHGLGVPPKMVIGSIFCITAQHGYAVGDELFVSLTDDNSAATLGVSVTFDATNLYLRYTSNSNAAFAVQQKSLGTRFQILNANFRFVVRAWA